MQASRLSTATTGRGAPPRRAGWARRLMADVLFVARRDRTWWMLPLVFVVLVLAGLMAAGASLGPLAPFLYPLF